MSLKEGDQWSAVDLQFLVYRWGETFIQRGFRSLQSYAQLGRLFVPW